MYKFLSSMAYKIHESGSPYSLGYRIFLANGNEFISPWHDIPYIAQPNPKVFNMVTEVPKWSNAKMEISTKEELNPIKQDVKKNKLRFVSNIFPHKGYIWNYGAIPQTWEDPNHVDSETQSKGDNDPIDICEIGNRVAKRGDVLQVKILGVLALIDEGETDWKLIGIDIRDRLADKLNDIQDVETEMPGYLRATVEWFRLYKVPTGSPENRFGFNGQFKGRDFAQKLIEETHEFWKKLIMSRDTGELICHNLTIERSPHKITKSKSSDIVNSRPGLGMAETIPEEVDEWHFIKQ